METKGNENMNKWGKPSGKGPMGLDWSGCYPATIIPFKDQTCREVDYEAFRQLIKGIMESDIAGLDPNEVEGLSRDETIKLMQVAKEEAQGRIPVTGKVEARNGQWTWDLIDEAKRVIDEGADVLYIHPWPEMDNMEDYVHLYKSFCRAVRDTPIISLTVGVPVPVLKQISLVCENIAAWKFDNNENIGLMKQLVWSMQDVEKETGRHICPLRAGDQALAECLINGAEGNFNGGASWRAKEDVAIFQAVQRGDYNEAFAIQKRMEPATEAVRGRYRTTVKPYGRFPYRYKIVCWLLGKIPNYYARLPRTAFSSEEVLMLREALIKSGLKVVREPDECQGMGISEY